MSWSQQTLSFQTKNGNVDLTSKIENLKEIKALKVGLCHLLLKHTSASISVASRNDNKLSSAMQDLSNQLVPENRNYIHNYEGDDDMPAHGKCVLLGSQLTIPITNGKLNLGHNQGIWLSEHRYYSHSRNIVVTIRGQ